MTGELAWAAGIFEGEGCITHHTGKRLAVTVKGTDHWVVSRFLSAVGIGKVYGPYENRCRDKYARKPFWVWMAFEDDAREVLELLSPLLSPRRLARAHALTGTWFPVKTMTASAGER
jgi:hypothetical protein